MARGQKFSSGRTPAKSGQLPESTPDSVMIGSHLIVIVLVVPLPPLSVLSPIRHDGGNPARSLDFISISHVCSCFRENSELVA
jgi:hypothetical protein